jgi:outer membrane biosynthesis protein TonB
METKNCRLCKKDLDVTQFEKNGKMLKTCFTCRSIVREAKKQKKENKNSESENSGSDSEKVTKLDFQETPVPEPEPKPTPEPTPESKPVQEPVSEPTVTPKNSPVVKPKLKRTGTVAKKEKNLPSTKRTRKLQVKN